MLGTFSTLVYSSDHIINLLNVTFIIHTFKCDEHPRHHHNSSFFTLLVVKKGLKFIFIYKVQNESFLKSFFSIKTFQKTILLKLLILLSL